MNIYSSLNWESIEASTRFYRYLYLFLLIIVGNLRYVNGRDDGLYSN